ncbi:MAG: NADH:flavin oxidoreductase/NADH oxidase [Methylotenera sp.]|nr:NADH:flavin oxidoreductase/NADH oxidase [Oligoflexia bacterium]
MSHLFTPLKIRNLVFKNRIWVSPMCQYSSQEGMPTDWHLVHLGSRAVGGAGLVMVEATAVSPEGRISPEDSGIWGDAHAQAFLRITDFVKAQGAVVGIQLAHAGRKGSTSVPWAGDAYVPPEQRGWQTLAPSPLAFKPEWPVPTEMKSKDIQKALTDFAEAAERSLQAGFQVVELHMAHGYLLHTFLSPLSNQRMDEYGGSFENRIRFPLEVARTVRTIWPNHLPVFVRISASDWVEGGWDLQQSIRFSSELKKIGVDLIDCSSGGLLPDAKIPVGPSYQVQFADAIRKEVGMLTAAVGMIKDPYQAESILLTGQADAVFLARGLLDDPHWPLHASKTLREKTSVWPKQYERAK